MRTLYTTSAWRCFDSFTQQRLAKLIERTDPVAPLQRYWRAAALTIVL